MILRPRLEDIRSISYYLGKIIIGLAFTMIVPLIVGLAFKEANPCIDFLIGFEIALALGVILTKISYTEKELNWMHGMVVVSLTWIAAMLLGAIPLYLSGHWKSFLDACFDSMSGFATTGLVLVQDLDHLSYAHNFWRHFIQFIGGQGIVIIAISFFVRGFSGAFKMYVGEAREERILPNVMHTARFIWLVSFTFLILGTLSLGVAAISSGIKPARAFFQGACLFMAAFDTGGFAPQSQSILYYHSFSIEIITMMIMVLGALNFRLHYHIWTGKRREIFKNIETVTLFISIFILFSLTAAGLSRMGIYSKPLMLFRKGFYQLLSAHTGTGYQTVYAGQFYGQWPQLSLIGLICAMALGGAVCSTTGAIKMLRIGVIFKALVEDIKRIILPEKAVVVQKYHHIRDVFLEDRQVRSAFLITLAYILLFGIGALAGMFSGYPFLYSLFESTSASANVGLSCGITSVNMPNLLKITYIIQMWAGRLEFMSIFTLIGFFVAVFKGKR